GKYFRATDNTVLNDIFSEIDSLEKTAIDVRNFTHTEDNYLPWGILALLLLALELILRNSVLRSMP
ncbi:MAG: aerotolerance regulator BatA, partial [Paramuribaculum sp.]|nr:aerotolerance regulator BatA [Paramuribaculum sp.]